MKRLLPHEMRVKMDVQACTWEKPVGYLGEAVFQWVNPKVWLVRAIAAGTFLMAGAGSRVVHAMSQGVLLVLAPCRVVFSGWPLVPAYSACRAAAPA